MRCVEFGEVRMVECVGIGGTEGEISEFSQLGERVECKLVPELTVD